MSRPTLSTLETRGRGSIDTLGRVLYALGRDNEIEALAQPDPPSSLKEVTKPVERERARR